MTQCHIAIFYFITKDILTWAFLCIRNNGKALLLEINNLLCFNTTFKYTEIFWIILHFQSRVYFSSVSKRPFKTFWTFLNIILNKPYHLWMSRMELTKTKKVPCLHVSRCWISFLKCQHNLEGAEKKEVRKKTHTHTQDVVYEKKKMIFQWHNIQYYVLVSKLSSLY